MRTSPVSIGKIASVQLMMARHFIALRRRKETTMMRACATMMIISGVTNVRYRHFQLAWLFFFSSLPRFRHDAACLTSRSSRHCCLRVDGRHDDVEDFTQSRAITPWADFRLMGECREAQQRRPS